MLSDFQSIVADLVRDDAERISAIQRDTAITSAVLRYSKDRPRLKIEDITVPGGNFMPLPTTWESDFSDLQALEYPIGRVPVSHINTNAWSIYATPVGLTIMVSIPLPSDDVVRATYTIAHVVDESTDTTPRGDLEPICCLAAASLCDQLSSFYSGSTDSTIQADAVEHSSKASEFAKRATALRKRYFDELGINPKKNVAAGVVVDLDLNNSQGRPRLTHRNGYH